jgi:hypothetical protein
MNKMERLDDVLKGRQPDRPPVSFWYHFPPECASGTAAVDAHVRHMETYDLDFLKIMDDNRYPRIGLPGGVISGVEDLERLTVLEGIEDRFSLQLELIGALVGRYRGQFRMITTVFNAWTVLRQMAEPESGQHKPPVLGAGGDPRDALLSLFLREAPEALSGALLSRNPRPISCCAASRRGRTAYSFPSGTTGWIRPKTGKEPTTAWLNPAI